MKDFFFDLVDLLELIFVDPLRYAAEVVEIPFATRPISNWLFSIFAALSVSTGMGILSAPYTFSTVSFLFFGFVANLIMFRYFPFFLTLVMDYYVRKKGRSQKTNFLLLFVRHSVIVFLIFAPITIILRALGLSGVGSGFFLLTILTILYALIVARGLKFMYELKDKDSFRFTFTALLVTIIFPFLMNLYTASNILQSLSGGN